MKRKSLALLIVLSLILLVACQGNNEPVKGVESSKFTTGDIEKIKVISSKANIKTGCDPDLPNIQTANKNEKFDVLSKVGDWFAVKLPDNRIGFIPTNQCKPIVDESKRPNVSTNLIGSNAPDTTPKTTTPNNIPDVTPNNTPNTTPNTTPNINNKPDNINNKPDNNTTPYQTNRDGDQNVNTTTNNTSMSKLSSAEQEMVNLVNAARKENGLPALIVDTELANVARIKAQDMIDNNYFSHNSPTYGSPFDMMKDFGIKYVHAGENIAGNSTVQKAHDALMKSPGHRANILSKDYTHIGIGIKEGGPYGNMFTQMFISKPQ